MEEQVLRLIIVLVLRAVLMLIESLLMVEIESKIKWVGDYVGGRRVY